MNNESFDMNFDMDIFDENNVDDEQEPTTKYLAFESDGLAYAINTDFVIEIIINNSITHLPKVPDYIRGVINLRGQIVPIIDIRLRMGRTITELTSSTCIIICSIDDVPIGILVDSVSQMIDIADSHISAPPLSKHQDLVDGIAKVNGMVLLLISSEELMKR